MKFDIAYKRGIFIGRTNSLLQEFGNISSQIILKLLNTSAMSFYGSNLWDLFGKESERLYNCYNVAIRNIFRVNRCTHRFLIKPISNSIHLKTILASKFVSFHRSLISSNKFPVRFLARLVEKDLRTVHGRNLHEIASQCNLGYSPDLSLLKPNLVKKNVEYKPIPEEDKWKVSICQELLSARDDVLELPGFTSDEDAELPDYLCVM